MYVPLNTYVHCTPLVYRDANINEVILLYAPIIYDLAIWVKSSGQADRRSYLDYFQTQGLDVK